ncbi:hypothetical protein GCM10022226_50440 [Sphaerisporangium flaviroseum]|uniref:WD40 repeat domain-containing protein n=1 Tax=Sphaerisporangium flaviroseum TaxID=509199 RepID=A0ABP7IQB6_9ACTN
MSTRGSRASAIGRGGTTAGSQRGSSAFGNDYPDDHTVRVWNVARRRETAILTGHTDRVQTVAFSPDGTILAGGGGGGGTIRLWAIR